MVTLNSNNKNIITESVLTNTPSQFILNSVLSDGGIKQFSNNDDNIDLIENFIKKEFNEIKLQLQSFDTIDDFDDTEVEPMLAKLINKCKTIEKPIRHQLEKIAFNIILKIFNIPEDTIQVDFSLVDNVDFSKTNISIDSENIYDFVSELETIQDLSELKKEINKRKALNILSFGYAINKVNKILNDGITNIPDELIILYKKIILLNTYLLFTKENLEITEKNKMQMGTVEIIIGDNRDKVRINAQAMIFPVLLSEGIRGFMELFSSHGLPNDINETLAIIKSADYLKAEPIAMVAGIPIWNRINKYIPNDELLPYMFMKIAKIKKRNFQHYMSEIVANTKTGAKIMKKIESLSKNEFEYNKFNKKMDDISTSKNLIMDEYIHPDEL